MSEYRNALPVGTVLDRRYRIEAVLGVGGFGIVYRVVHARLGKNYAIKEYLPQEVAVREGVTVHPLSSEARTDYEDGRERFLREARQLVQFGGHPNIVTCADYFDANGTAYLVMAYEDGLPLSELLARREAQGRPLQQAETIRLLRPLLDGLRYVHRQDVLHRDIKPGNIFIRRSDEQPVLLDFGAAKEEFSRKSKSRAAYTVGYAAMEQVESAGHLGPWTDVHAVGGVLYRIVTGENPPDVQSRISARVRGRADTLVLDETCSGERFNAAFLALVRDCMALNESDRIQSVEVLLERLDSLGAAHEKPPEQSPHEDAESASAEPERGADVQMTASVDHMLAQKGGSSRVPIKLRRHCGVCGGSARKPGVRWDQGQVQCSACDGHGIVESERRYEVRIPPGIRTGQKIRLSGLGEPGRSGGEPGDLYIRVKVSEPSGESRSGPEEAVAEAGAADAGSADAAEAVADSGPAAKNRLFVTRLARGDFGLAKTYWLFGVVVTVIANAAAPFLEGLDLPRNREFAAALVLGASYMGYSLPLLVGMWNAATRYAGPRIWPVLVKVIAFLGAASTLFAVWTLGQLIADTGAIRLPLIMMVLLVPGSLYLVDVAVLSWRNRRFDKQQGGMVSRLRVLGLSAAPIASAAFAVYLFDAL